MCIRDRDQSPVRAAAAARRLHARHGAAAGRAVPAGRDRQPCLLYTSDAADERSSVDLGGRRIIKKKKPGITRGDTYTNTHEGHIQHHKEEIRI